MLALDEYNNAVVDYQAATSAATPSLVTQWMQADTRPREVSKGVWTSVYQTQRTKGTYIIVSTLNIHVTHCLL